MTRVFRFASFFHCRPRKTKLDDATFRIEFHRLSYDQSQVDFSTNLPGGASGTGQNFPEFGRDFERTTSNYDLATGPVRAEASMSMAKKKTLPTRSKDVPATLGMLHIVRDELRSDIRSLEHKMDSRFQKVEGKLAELKTEVKGQLTSEISGLKSAMEKMSSSMHQMQLLVEEQRAENRIVMDGLTNLFSRQERIEDRVDALEKI
jgi:hypothetical protein